MLRQYTATFLCDLYIKRIPYYLLPVKIDAPQDNRACAIPYSSTNARYTVLQSYGVCFHTVIFSCNVLKLYRSSQSLFCFFHLFVWSTAHKRQTSYELSHGESTSTFRCFSLFSVRTLYVRTSQNETLKQKVSSRNYTTTT